MKYLAIGLLLCLPTLADWRWEGRDETRRELCAARVLEARALDGGRAP